MHSGQPKPNLRCKRKALIGSEGLLEIVGLKVTVEDVMAGTLRRAGERRVTDCKSCDIPLRHSVQALIPC